ncbi:hypothetical protein SDJN02_08510, partial [Cucurbita argyrosperma subsp. argyrosperma]
MKLKAKVSRENKVLVSVYTERQEPRVAVNRVQRDDVNKTVRNQWKKEIANKGYNRRTELLKYSQRLRKSAQSPASPYLPTPEPISLVNLRAKPKGARFTSCFGNLIQRSRKALTSFQPKNKRQNQNQSSGSTKNANDNKRIRRIRLLKFTCT